jgi:flavin reductase (DIM6/NTAB) family NADH-FMN oxidoreductase RutF
MFYDTRIGNHNLASNPFKSCIIPRPIGWISSIDKNGIINLAPYSYFNAISDIPPMVMFASGFKADGSLKDSIKNIQETKEFVVNIASYSSRDKMNLSSTPLDYGVSEVQKYNITTAPSNIVQAPRIAESLIALECEYIKTVDLEVKEKKASSQMVLGHVVGIYIDEKVLTEGKIDISKLQPIARLGYNEYCVIKESFKMNRM